MQQAIHDRKEIISKASENADLSKLSFSSDYIKDFNQQYNDILLEDMEENTNDFGKYYTKDERALIIRILDYKDNYFLWFCDFSLPYDDNLSKRALRGTKTKLKVAGQFQNIDSAKNCADIKTYIETCYRNGINPTDALIRLMDDNPFTVEDIFPELQETCLEPQKLEEVVKKMVNLVINIILFLRNSEFTYLGL